MDNKRKLNKSIHPKPEKLNKGTILSKHTIIRFFLIFIISIIALCSCLNPPLRIHSSYPLSSFIDKNLKMEINDNFIFKISSSGWEAWERKRWKQAEEDFFNASKFFPADNPDYKKALFLAYFANCRQKITEKCINSLPMFMDQFLELKPYLYLFIAQKAYESGQKNISLKLLENITDDSSPWIINEKLLFSGNINYELQNWIESQENFEEFIFKNPSADPEVRYKLAVSLEKQLSEEGNDSDTGEKEIDPSDMELIEKAITYYKQILYLFPLSSYVLKAQNNLNNLGKFFGDKKLVDLDIREKIISIEKIYNNQYYKKVIKEGNDLLSSLDTGGPDWCSVSLYIGKSIFKMRRWSESANHLESISKKCSLPDIRIPALFLAAKAYNSVDNFQKINSLTEELEKLYNDHSYCDDAAILRADALISNGNSKEGLKVLSEIPIKYKNGDMKQEAIWRVYQYYYQNKQNNEALKFLKQLDKVENNNLNYHEFGRSLYWIGKIEEKQNQIKEAMDTYKKVINLYPLTFYSIFALNRLEKLEKLTPYTYEKLLKTDPLPSWFNDNNISPDVLKKWTIIYYLKILGLDELADKELKSWNYEIPEPILWKLALYYNEKGNYSQSHNILRRQLKGWYNIYPIKQEAKEMWNIAYPVPWRDVFKANSQKYQIPEELLYAIAREESGFYAQIKSWAGAIGLMQLMPGTAKQFASSIKLPFDEQSLTRPEINVEISSNFVAYLWKHFNKNPVYTIAAYNAGAGAVDRWIKKSSFDLDEFVENIPYGQTKQYTKRVLSSYAVYKFLLDSNNRIYERLVRLNSN